jgi:hypothetical protein
MWTKEFVKLCHYPVYSYLCRPLQKRSDSSSSKQIDFHFQTAKKIKK